LEHSPFHFTDLKFANALMLVCGQTKFRHLKTYSHSISIPIISLTLDFPINFKAGVPFLVGALGVFRIVGMASKKHSIQAFVVVICQEQNKVMASSASIIALKASHSYS